MAEYSGDLLRIYNGTGASLRYNEKLYYNGDYVPLGKFVTYTVDFPKLWSSDTGRSMTGENKGTLIGIFPKIKIKLGKLSDDDMSALIKLTAQAQANVSYYDVGYQQLTTAKFYFGDISDELARKASLIHKPKEFSIVSVKKRGAK